MKSDLVNRIIDRVEAWNAGKHDYNRSLNEILRGMIDKEREAEIGSLEKQVSISENEVKAGRDEIAKLKEAWEASKNQVPTLKDEIARLKKEYQDNCEECDRHFEWETHVKIEAAVEEYFDISTEGLNNSPFNVGYSRIRKLCNRIKALLEGEGGIHTRGSLDGLKPLDVRMKEIKAVVESWMRKGFESAKDAANYSWKKMNEIKTLFEGDSTKPELKCPHCNHVLTREVLFCPHCAKGILNEGKKPDDEFDADEILKQDYIPRGKKPDKWEKCKARESCDECNIEPCEDSELPIDLELYVQKDEGKQPQRRIPSLPRGHVEKEEGKKPEPDENPIKDFVGYEGCSDDEGNWNPDDAAFLDIVDGNSRKREFEKKKREKPEKCECGHPRSVHHETRCYHLDCKCKVYKKPEKEEEKKP